MQWPAGPMGQWANKRRAKKKRPKRKEPRVDSFPRVVVVIVVVIVIESFAQ